MSEIRFQWASRKAANLRKHGVSFTEAETVFLDEHGLLLDDPEHSGTEDRFILLGSSTGGRRLIVVHAYRAAAGAHPNRFGAKGRSSGAASLPGA